MTPRPSVYLFNRLNMIAHYESKEEFLLVSLKKPITVFKRNFVWGFFNISPLNSEFGAFFHGYLVKFEPESDEEVANPETQRLNDQFISNRVIAKAPFFIHVKSGLLIYKPISNRISASSFKNIFVELFKKANDYFFIDAEIQTIQDQIKLLEELKKFTRLYRISLYLHPSNPSNSERWRHIDERLKRLEAAKIKEEIEIKKEGTGLAIVEDPETLSKIYMAEDGYGKARITGESDGITKTISTQDNPVKEKVEEEPDNIEGTFERLTKKIRSIFNRFTYEN
jgi:hypothetical protein